MSDERQKLKPLLNKRVTVRGSFAKWDDHWIRNQRQVGRVCISQPEIDDEVICHHVWVVDVPHWKQYRDAVGSQVTFDAVVRAYATRSNETNYCLGSAGDLTFLHAPALTIPDPPQHKKLTSEEHRTDDEQVSITVHEPQVNPIEKIRQITAWAKASGGYDLVEKVLVNMPPMPVPELLEYIKAMKV